jgi:acyl-CoA thioesterase-1
VAPAFAKENLTKILQTATARNLPVMLIGMSATSNFGADYKTEFDAIYPDLAAKFDAVLYPDFLAALIALNDRNTTMNTLMQRDGLHPNAQGMALIVDDMAPVIADFLDRVADGQ